MTTRARKREPTNEAAPPSAPGFIWDTITGDPGIAVSITDEALHIVYANETAAKMYLGRTAAEVTGHKLTEFLPSSATDEAFRIMRETRDGGVPIVARTIWEGRQVLTTVRRIPVRGGSDHYLRIGRYAPGSPEAPSSTPQTAATEFVQLGPLDVLTPRELEVLCLIGQAFISKEIATVLGCTAGTVEVHRRSIGRKLRTTDRVKLAMIAREAGLSLRDANRARIVRGKV